MVRWFHGDKLVLVCHEVRNIVTHAVVVIIYDVARLGVARPVSLHVRTYLLVAPFAPLFLPYPCFRWEGKRRKVEWGATLGKYCLGDVLPDIVSGSDSVLSVELIVLELSG